MPYALFNSAIFLFTILLIPLVCLLRDFVWKLYVPVLDRYWLIGIVATGGSFCRASTTSSRSCSGKRGTLADASRNSIVEAVPGGGEIYLALVEIMHDASATLFNGTGVGCGCMVCMVCM